MTIRKGKRRNEKGKIGVKIEMIRMYRVVRILIMLRGTAASTEVVNLSSLFGMVRIRLLGSTL